jgi:hypothetical protein
MIRAYLIIALASFMLFVCFIGIIRNTWVYRQRGKWIDHDVYDFSYHAPSYESMLFRFWIWNLADFGFDPTRHSSHWRAVHNRGFVS